MATESGDAGKEPADLERPPFRGCVFCYGAEMTYYGLRKLATRAGTDTE